MSRFETRRALFLTTLALAALQLGCTIKTGDADTGQLSHQDTRTEGEQALDALESVLSGEASAEVEAGATALGEVLTDEEIDYIAMVEWGQIDGESMRADPVVRRWLEAVETISARQAGEQNARGGDSKQCESGDECAQDASAACEEVFEKNQSGVKSCAKALGSTGYFSKLKCIYAQGDAIVTQIGECLGGIKDEWGFREASGGINDAGDWIAECDAGVDAYADADMAVESGLKESEPCEEVLEEGGDTPEQRVVDLGGTRGSFDFWYETFSQQDRITITYDNQLLFDTGCVGASETVTLNFDGDSSRVVIEVEPNCAGGSGTAWEFSVSCPE